VDGQRAKPLAQIWNVSDDNPARRRDNVIQQLQRLMTVNVSQKTGVIAIAIKTRDAALSHQIAVSLLAELDRYNLERRQSQAAAERRFAERRLSEVGDNLREAEGQLQAFLQQNRRYDASPELSFRRERLVREVSLREQMFSVLSEMYEQAKLEEVRDTPVITVIDKPEVPPRPDSRGLLLKSILGLVLGGLVGVTVALAKEFRNAKDAFDGAQEVGKETPARQ
jgi:uncharacterized protein involved in exopolysaccharide biosynthesis